MYLEISYSGYVLAEIPLIQIGNAANLQPILEGLFHQFNFDYNLEKDYGSDKEGIGCFVTDLAINAIYSD